MIRRPFNDEFPVPYPHLALAALELAALRRRGVCTLVHCHRGVSRSPTAVALYWMARDDITWDEAVDRLIQRRPQVDPKHFLATTEMRLRAVEEVKELLRGDPEILERARARKAEFIESIRRRPDDSGGEDSGWNEIEPGLAVGDSSVSNDALQRSGTERVLLLHYTQASTAWSALGDEFVVSEKKIRHIDQLEISALAEAVATLREWRHEDRRVCVAGWSNELDALLVVCLRIMQERGWDFISAMWYIGTRRPSIWNFVPELMTTDWPGLLAVCS